MSGMNLPAHWKTVRIEEIADVRGGSSFPKEYQGNTEGQYPFYKVSDMNLIGNEVLMQDSNNWVEEDTVKTLRAKLFLKDTVIFPKVGAAVHTNKKRMLSSDGLVDNNVMGIAVRDNNLCVPYFLLYWFESIDLANLSNPGPLPSITAAKVKNTEIPLPSLPEQRAIASVLGTIQEAKFARQKEIALERERKAALMDYLFSHGTKDEPCKQTEIGEIPESWQLRTIQEVCDKIIDYRGKTPQFVDSGVVHLRSSNVKEGRLALNQITYVSEETYASFMKRGFPKADDVIFTTEGPLGESAMVPPNFRFSLAQRMIVLRANEKILNPRFLLFVLYSEQVKKDYFGRSTGSTVKGISSKSFQQVQVPLPSLSEQRKIANVFTAVDARIAALEQETARLDELFHAMLEELMTGQRSAVPLIDSELPN